MGKRSSFLWIDVIHSNYVHVMKSHPFVQSFLPGIMIKDWICCTERNRSNTKSSAIGESEISNHALAESWEAVITYYHNPLLFNSQLSATFTYSYYILEYNPYIAAGACSCDLLKWQEGASSYPSVGLISDNAVPVMISRLRRAPLEKLASGDAVMQSVAARGALHSRMVTRIEGTR